MTEMIFITQLIYIVKGREDTFNEFESIAIPIISKYNGRLLFRIKPNENDFVECIIDKPYEVHLIEFATEKDFDNFKLDKERKKFLHLKNQSIRLSILYQGIQL